MQTVQPSFFLRDDTFLGVCEALGEDFRFNPLWLRVALGVALIWNPFAVVAAYLAAFVVIAVSRLLVPNPRMALPEPVYGAEAQPVEADVREPLAVAA